MNSLYNNLNEKKFKVLTIIFCFLSDIFIIGHLVLSFGEQEKFQQSLELALKMMEKQNPGISNQLPPNFAAELWQMMLSTVIGIVCFYLLFHSVIYVAHHYKKGFARGYIKFYSWTGGILMGLYALINFTSSAVLFLIPSTLLMYVALGMKRFPEIKKTEE